MSAPHRGVTPEAPVDLWAAARTAWAGARASGALQPIATRLRHIEDGGLRFQVRVVASRDHKLEAHARQRLQAQAAGRRIDPFLPYHPAMFVADLAPAHVALLNRFPVLDHHLLVVTRAFEGQESLLPAADFTALVQCMRAIPGPAFYNAGALLVRDTRPLEELRAIGLMRVLCQLSRPPGGPA